MAYFQRRMDGIERGGKIAADVFCVLLLGVMALGCLGVLFGIIASVLVVLGVLTIDYFTADPDDQVAAVDSIGPPRRPRSRWMMATGGDGDAVR